MIKTEQALVPTKGRANRTQTNANRLVKPVTADQLEQTNRIPDSIPVAPLSEELVNRILKGRGARGWLRAANIGRVLGLLSLYLFLDTYDVRANFNQRAADRLRAEAMAHGRMARFQEWSRDLDRHFLDKLIRSLRFFVFRGADGSARKEMRLARQASWLRESLIALGPTFIKIGQALGTRADLLPLAYVRELSSLQDQVPPFPTAEAYARIESELGLTLQQAYAEIDAEPIAAASLGQVYRARLHSGHEVAVKVQRPNLAAILSFDIAVLYRLVQVTNRFFPKANENADWEGMLREFYATIFEEIDYVKEGRNADRFRGNFRTWRVIRVPALLSPDICKPAHSWHESRRCRGPVRPAHLAGQGQSAAG